MPSLADSDQRATSSTPESTGRHAFLVAAGILLSRLFGLLRQTVFNHYFQLSDAADAFLQALRIPNFLLNLFGEGVLSASFIPVYARLLQQGDEEEAGRVAGAVGALLALAVSALLLVGELIAPLLADMIAMGYHGAKRAMTVRLVRILFPGAAFLAMGAWCLGILNSHRKFFLSYSAPVAWNLAMIVALAIYGGRRDLDSLAVVLAWASVAGSVLLFLVQLPNVLQLVPRLRFAPETGSENVREVVRNFGPVFVSRGVVQISAYIDGWLSSLLGTGAASGVFNAQIIYMLPVSLFGMSIAAAELPAMSSALGTPAETAAYLRRRLDGGLRRIAFLIIPSAMAFLALGGVIAGTLAFHHTGAQFVWRILGGSAVGLLASTMGRLYSSTYYALRDTRTPLRYAVVRVALTTILGYLFALHLPRWIGLSADWGVAGLTASAGIAGWVEFTLLRRTLNRRIGVTGLHAGFVSKLWVCAAAAAATAWGAKFAVGAAHPILDGAVILGAYGLAYFAAAWLLGIPECREILRRVRR
jgi:putative peptidoglycan lipid II flippase